MMKQTYNLAAIVLAASLLFVVVLVADYAQQPPKDESHCNTDRDCACGTHIKTGECFYGNKDYVNEEKQCPDFCSGIAGNLAIKCVNSTCNQARI